MPPLFVISKDPSPFYGCNDEQEEPQIGIDALHHHLPSMRKNVQFNEHIEIEFIPHRNETPLHEIDARWYVEEDYLKFERDASETLYLMIHTPHVIDGENYTQRGLEGLTPDATERRHRKKDEVWNAVFEEQNHQRQNGDGQNDLYWIAAIYHQVTRDCEIRAQRLARGEQPEQIEECKYDQVDDTWVTYDPQSIPGTNLSSKWTLQDEPVDENDGFSDSWITEVAKSAPTHSRTFCI